MASSAPRSQILRGRFGSRGSPEKSDISPDGAFSFSASTAKFDLVLEALGQGQVDVGELDLRFGGVLDFEAVLPQLGLLVTEPLPPSALANPRHDYALTSVSQATGVGITIETGKGAITGERSLLPGHFIYDVRDDSVTLYEHGFEITAGGTYQLDPLEKR